MAAHNMKGSLRMKCSGGPYYDSKRAHIAPMRPGKTQEDHRTGAWMPKSERNSRQAMYRGD